MTAGRGPAAAYDAGALRQRAGSGLDPGCSACQGCKAGTAGPNLWGKPQPALALHPSVLQGSAADCWLSSGVAPASAAGDQQWTAGSVPALHPPVLQGVAACSIPARHPPGLQGVAADGSAALLHPTAVHGVAADCWLRSSIAPAMTAGIGSRLVAANRHCHK